MTLRIVLLVLLCSASLPLLAAEVRHASGNGSCPTAGEERRNGGADPSDDAQRVEAAAAAKEKPTAPQGGNNENTVRGPRWHSFLPGMFR